MTLINHWQKINIRAIWFHLLLGVLAAGSNFTVHATVPEKTVLTKSIFSAVKIQYCYQYLSSLPQKIANQAKPTCLFSNQAYNRYTVRRPILHTGLWVAAELGIRSDPFI